MAVYIDGGQKGTRTVAQATTNWQITPAASLKPWPAVVLAGAFLYRAPCLSYLHLAETDPIRRNAGDRVGMHPLPSIPGNTDIQSLGIQIFNTKDFVCAHATAGRRNG